jgi:hypothetical protein
VEFDDLLLVEQAQAPTGEPLRGRREGQCNQFCFRYAVENPRPGGIGIIFAPQRRLEPLLDQLAPGPFDSGNAGVQRRGNPAVAPAFAKLRYVRPQQDAGLRQQLGGTLASRDRNAIYAYLTAVNGLVGWWTAEGREVDRARRALRLQRLAVSDREDLFAAVIRCTADPAKADKRTRSKWSRVMGYAAAYKPNSEPLDQFARRKGGINACAARFSRFFGAKGHVEAQASSRRAAALR